MSNVSKMGSIERLGWKHPPVLKGWDVLEEEGFGRGTRWSPNGDQLLVACEGCKYKVYQASVWKDEEEPFRMKASNEVFEAGYAYDWKWHPCSEGSLGSLSCFASASRGVPVHLWNARDASLMGTYRVYDQQDEILPSHSVAFNVDGSKLFCGCLSSVAAFHTSRPGRDYSVMYTDVSDDSKEGLRGIVSCMDVDKHLNGLLALGTFSKRVAVYDQCTSQAVLFLDGHDHGVTQVQFSACSNYLYTAARMEEQIICWDLRYCAGEVYRIQRSHNATNQRIQFDIQPTGRHLAVGDTQGTLSLYDLRDGMMVNEYKIFERVLNAVSFHPQESMLATTSGSRIHAASYSTDSESDSGPEAITSIQSHGDLHSEWALATSSLCLWKCEFRVPCEGKE